MIQERIEQLRKLMAERKIDAYLIPTSDFHESEYVGEYFKCRQFMTGFTGSAGTAIVTADEAGLWTDGRYFVQAAKQLEGSPVKLFKMGQEGVPTTEEYLADKLPKNGVLGFDGRVINEQLGEKLKKKLEEKNISFAYSEDLVGMVWEDRPLLSAEPVWVLEEKYAGKSATDKLNDLREAMKANKATAHIITTVDDIVWLLNIRGNDVPNNPVVLSYLILTETDCYLFINKATLNDETESYLKGVGVTILPYDEIYTVVGTMKFEKVMLEKSKANYMICRCLDETSSVIDVQNPTALAKAIKNPTEVENTRKAHIKDGVAVTKFMYWLKKNIGKIPMDEVSVSDYLEDLRRQQEGNLGLSFDTISAYGDNAAMCHYKANDESKKVLEPRGLYLVDSGGQYYEGTTDITRTIALGPVTDQEKMHFTLVAISMLRLADVKFLQGCRGLNFDYVAREPFWTRGLDFNHGTGHGVGYLLNVHERPNGIRWRFVPERQEDAILEEGMITSDEPGLYFEGKYGIRTENLIVCEKDYKNEYGQFMKFDHLTFVPIDLDAIDPEYMEPRDIQLLNKYHQEVYEKISPYLEEEEKEWLKEVTRPLPVRK